MLDLMRLKYFRVVAETASLRKAAELLNVAPSTLSKAIKTLETELGASLVEPEGRGIVITAKGRLVSERARRLIGDADALATDVKRNAEPNETIRIGSHSTFTTYFLAQFMATKPEERFHVRQAMPGEMERLLVEHAVDYALTYAPTPMPEVKYIRVAEADLALYGQAGRAAEFAAMDLTAIPTVAPTTSVADSALRATGFDGWPREFFQRSIRYEIEGFEAALAACRRGLAVGYFPSFVIDLHNEEVRPDRRLVTIPVPKSFGAQKLAIYVVRRRDDPDDAVVKLLAKALRTACRKAREPLA